MSSQESVLSVAPGLSAGSSTPPSGVLSDAGAALSPSGLAPLSLDSPIVNFSTVGGGIAASSAATPALEDNVFGQAYLLGNSDVEKPTVVQAYLVDSDKLALRIETSDIAFGSQVPYEPQPQDEIFVNGLDTWVNRDGEEIGFLAGADRKILRTFDEFVGESLDVGWADNRLNYTIRSTEDANFSAGVNPEALFRKTKPIDMGNTAVFSTVFSLSHTLYLDLPQAVVPGQSYTLDFAGDVLEDLTFTFDPLSSLSEAVHVTQVGFRPDDPIKQGYLSTWMGAGGAITYKPGLKFQLVDDATSTVAYSGTVELDKAAAAPEATSNKNFALTDIYKLDFSDFTQAGKYRLAVEGVGTSLPFEIGNSTWSDAFYTSSRGFYYQRSGIALETPYADRDRPRAFHPDDGVKVYQSRASLMELQLNEDFSLDDIFANLTAQATDELLPNAWGGYYDAGDWDRRIDHLISSRSFIELAELFPDFYQEYSFNIPESNNELPDIIDEALWGIDFFRRLQKSDGGIPGGIESAEHPRTGETSWQESLQIYAFAPDMWSSFLYAGTAAQAAHWLKSNGFTAKGQEYLDSALKAMAFGERELAAAGGKSPFTEVGDARNLAALSLFRATGNQAWNQLFLETTSFVSDGAALFEFNSYDQREAAFLYSRIDFPGQDLRIKANAVEAILTEASESITFSDENSFNWTQENAFAAPVWDGALGSTNVQKILRAHWLTDNSLFLKYGILGTQVAMGANPENMTYTTGLGLRNPENPLIINDRVLGEKPVPGITLYGPNELETLGNFFILDQTADFTFPNIYDWPTLESYLDLYLFVPGSEFTLHQSMVPTNYALGYLAGRQSVGQDVGGIETVQSFLKGQEVDLNPKDGLNNPIQRLLVDNDTYQIRPNESLVVNATQGLLNGDSFDPKKPISIIVEDIPSSGGGIFLNKDGSFRYKPAKGFEGVETLTYRISNGVEQSSIATVSFQVGAVGSLPPDVPIAATPRSIRVPTAAPGTGVTPPVTTPTPPPVTVPPVVNNPGEPPSVPPVTSTPVPPPAPPVQPGPVPAPPASTPPTPGIVPPVPAPPAPTTPVFAPSTVPVAIAPPLNSDFGSSQPQTPPAPASTAVGTALALPPALPVALPVAPAAPVTPPAVKASSNEPTRQDSEAQDESPTVLAIAPGSEPDGRNNSSPDALFLGGLLSDELPNIAQGDFDILRPDEFDEFFSAS